MKLTKKRIITLKEELKTFKNIIKDKEAEIAELELIIKECTK